MELETPEAERITRFKKTLDIFTKYGSINS